MLIANNAAGVMHVSLGETEVTVPVLAVSGELGERLAEAGNPRVHMLVHAQPAAVTA